MCGYLLKSLYNFMGKPCHCYAITVPNAHIMYVHSVFECIILCVHLSVYCRFECAECKHLLGSARCLHSESVISSGEDTPGHHTQVCPPLIVVPSFPPSLFPLVPPLEKLLFRACYFSSFDLAPQSLNCSLSFSLSATVK